MTVQVWKAQIGPFSGITYSAQYSQNGNTRIVTGFETPTLALLALVQDVLSIPSGALRDPASVDDRNPLIVASGGTTPVPA